MVREIRVSVVMPVFNGSKFIEKSLRSVLEQDFSDFEIIVVDDGSTDESSSIVRDFFGENRLPNVSTKLLSQENQGVSAARNRGLSNAEGSYAVFLDADDIMNPGFLKKLYRKARETDADITMCGFNMVDENGNTIRSYMDSYQFFREEIPGTQATLMMLKKTIWLWTGNGFFSRGFLESGNISYAHGATHGEDQEFALKALFLSKSVTCVPECLVEYVQRKTSIVREPTLRQFHLVGSMRRLLRFFEEHGAEKEIIDLMRKNKIPESYLTVLSSLYSSGYSRTSLKRIVNHPFVKEQVRSFEFYGDSMMSKTKSFLIQRIPYLYFWYHKLIEKSYFRPRPGGDNSESISKAHTQHS